MSSEKNVYITKRQAQILTRYSSEMTNRPALCRIQYDGKRFAYWSNHFIGVRYDLEGLDIPDGSWIDLLMPDSIGAPNEKFDFEGNLAAWTRVCTARSSWDLMDPERWRKPDETSSRFPEMAHLFKLPDNPPVIDNIAFNPRFLNDTAELVRAYKTEPLIMRPSTAKPSTGPWWCCGQNEHQVDGLIVPIRFAGDKPYVEPPTKDKPDTSENKDAQ
ncbi:hypothetical protein [Bifidobacterium sp. ESL0745]|uniref:hypothetical protein n=1 Tax=Bifidobacterium sp. ESL0745 TaxID=2983226 RepID=UPI0023F8DA9C|nr:hypothetical protein [Bifidobacterium sp. ESL0745]MDF7665696.1 hypothetical protein [Bifidobacterium sp. ESL0745]